MTNRVIDHIVSKVIQHHHDSGAVLSKGKGGQFDFIDDNMIYVESIVNKGGTADVEIGNVLIALIAICERNGTSIETCLNAAYDEIRGIK